MQIITIEELINYKILPFNIYSKDGELLFATGDVLTPGKFLQLRNTEAIYRVNDDELEPTEKQEIEKKHKVVINIDMPVSIDIQSGLQYDFLDYVKTKKNLDRLVNKIQFLVENDLKNIVNLSQLRLLGEYETCHLINTAIISAFYFKKSNWHEDDILNIISKILSDEKEPDVVKIIDYFDDLAFNKTEYTVLNVKDAIKILLQFESKNFSTKFLYSFVYMFNYNDTKPFEEMKK